MGQMGQRVIKGGAKKAHDYTKCRVIQNHIETGWGMGGQVLPHPKDVADHELDKWKPIWGSHKADRDINEIFSRVEMAPIEPLTMELFDRVGQMYPEATGVGSDGIHPRSIKKMSRGPELVSLLYSMLQKGWSPG